jgi:hypothetical protein
MNTPGNENEKEFTPKESLQLISEMMDKVRDDKLWRIAKKRSAFKMLFMVYILMNGMLVGLWYFTTGPGSHFWPIWPILGWGLGILYQFVDAYMGNTVFSEEKEFQRLKRKK